MSVDQLMLYPNFYGYINDAMIEDINDLDDGSIIVINSNGGKGSLGIRLAEVIAKKRISIIVDSYCISACAEYLLPAAATLRFVNEPLIGYHWNTISLGYHSSDDTDELHSCERIAKNRVKEFWSRHGVDHDFWRLTYSKIGPVEYDVEYDEQSGCPLLRNIRARHSLWFPDSVTMRQELGLEFIGSLCADNKKCPDKEIPKYFKKTVTYVSSDDIIHGPFE